MGSDCGNRGKDYFSRATPGFQAVGKKDMQLARVAKAYNFLVRASK